MKIRLKTKKQLLGNVKAYDFEFEEEFIWRAGQYMIAKIDHEPKDLRGKMRFITISSAPHEKVIRITTRFFGKKASSFKKALDSLKIGKHIEIKGPDGDIFIGDFKKNYVFIAGGIGITPFYSILKQLEFEDKMPRIKLLYANKDKKFLFDAFLNDISEKFENFKMFKFISPKKIKPSDIKRLDLNLKKTIFFISGPENMIYKIKLLLNKLGVKDENMKEDYFTGYRKI